MLVKILFRSVPTVGHSRDDHHRNQSSDQPVFNGRDTFFPVQILDLDGAELDIELGGESYKAFLALDEANRRFFSLSVLSSF
ncbi:hypothetical protein [Acidithiobacillus ferrooxidans]|uniref:hypothetical protein n=1 Tax=Acidithiobacillus ferrooxidans TaxID=920 RepID=UPI003FD8F721